MSSCTRDTPTLTWVLERFGFQFSSPQPTPLSTGHSLLAPPLDESVEPSGPYLELVGCLMYLMMCTRPDLAYPLSLLARYVAPELDEPREHCDRSVLVAHKLDDAHKSRHARTSEVSPLVVVDFLLRRQLVQKTILPINAVLMVGARLVCPHQRSLQVPSAAAIPPVAPRAALAAPRVAPGGPLNALAALLAAPCGPLAAPAGPPVAPRPRALPLLPPLEAPFGPPARNSMIHAAAPHFLWPFAVRYAAHQLNLWPRVSLPETSPPLRWTGEVGDASVFRVWGSRAFVRDTSADKLSARAIPCVFLGFPPDAPGWQFYHPTSRRVFPSQDVTFDESVPFYHLFPSRSAPPPPPPLFFAPGPPPLDPLPPLGPAPSGVSQVDPLPRTMPVEVAVSSGAARGAASGGGASRGAEPGGAESEGAGSGGAEPGGAEPAGAERGGAEPEGVEPGGAESEGAESGGRTRLWSGAARVGVSAAGDTGVGGVGVTARAGGTGGAAAAGLGGPHTRDTGAAGTGSVGGPGARGAGDPLEPRGARAGRAGAAGGSGAGGAGARGAGTGDTGTVDPGVGGAGAGGALSGELASPLPAPSPYIEQTGGLTERREPESRPASPVRDIRTGHRVPRPRPPPVPGNHAMALRPSSVPLRVPLPPLPQSSLPAVPDPQSYRARAASPTVSHLLATLLTDPTFKSIAASPLVAELVDFAAACRLDYTTALVAESESASPPSVGGECALGTDILEDTQEDLECLAVAVPRFASMLLAPEGDPDAPDIPTPRSYAEAITVPLSRANIVDGMWIFRASLSDKGVDYFQTFSPTPKITTLQILLHVAAQRDYELHFLDFSTTFLQGSLHEEIWLRRPSGFIGSFPAALWFTPSTADPSLFLRTDTSLPPFYVLVYVDDLVFAIADTEALTLVKSELQKRHTCTDLAHMVHQVLQRFGFQFSSPQPTPLSTSHSLSAPPSDESVEPSGPYRELLGCLMYLMMCTRPDLAYPLGILDRYVAPGRHRKVHWDSAKRVLRYLCSTSGMGLVLGGRGLVVLTGHADASWELRWLTYLLTDLGEQPRSPPQRGHLRLAYVATRANSVDIFTKALPLCDHQSFSTVLGLRSFNQAALYIVYLNSAPSVLTYRGGIAGLRATATSIETDDDDNDDGDSDGGGDRGEGGGAEDGSGGRSGGNVGSSDPGMAEIKSVGVDGWGMAKRAFQRGVAKLKTTAAAAAAAAVNLDGPPRRRPDVHSAAVQEFSHFLKDSHRRLISSAGLPASRIVHSYRYLMNAFSARLTAAEAEKLKKQAWVDRVERSQMVRTATTHTPDFLNLPNKVWPQLGGESRAGENVIIGLIDSGIWPEHPAFSDKVNFPSPHTSHPAFLAGELLKIIGAQWFVAGLKAEGGRIDPSIEFLSPRDANSHGSWCAGAAAGNAVRVKSGAQPLGTARGMAPRARLAIYKALWFDGQVAMGSEADVYKAVDRAVADGVDLLSMSVAFSDENYFKHLPLMRAAQAGVLPVLVAGNLKAPPDSDDGQYRTIRNASPYYLTVAASTTDRAWPPQATLRLQDGAATTASAWTAGGRRTATADDDGGGGGVSAEGVTVVGVTYHAGTAHTVNLSLVDAATAAASNVPLMQARMCLPGSLSPALVAGRMVLCEAGGTTPEAKAGEVRRAGGRAIVIASASATAGSVGEGYALDLPSLVVNRTMSQALRSFLNSSSRPSFFSFPPTTSSLNSLPVLSPPCPLPLLRIPSTLPSPTPPPPPVPAPCSPRSHPSPTTSHQPWRHSPWPLSHDRLVLSSPSPIPPTQTPPLPHQPLRDTLLALPPDQPGRASHSALLLLARPLMTTLPSVPPSPPSTTSPTSPRATLSSLSLQSNQVAPVMAPFSSTGPIVDPSLPPGHSPEGFTNDILKPDITGPGVNLLGPMASGKHGEAAYQLLSGTSMAVPHLVGIAALIMQKYPSWSPAAVKSAIMTTGTVFNNRNEPIRTASGHRATPWNFGSGHVVAVRAMDPGLVYNVGAKGYMAFLFGINFNSASKYFQHELQQQPQKGSRRAVLKAYDLNLPNICVSNLVKQVTVVRRVTNVAGQASKYRVRVVAPKNVRVVVAPGAFTIAPGASQVFSVTFTVVQATRAFSFGSLTWVDGTHRVRSVLAVQPVQA
ncbi:unnamed protein product [Closterium sp. NIES-53]